MARTLFGTDGVRGIANKYPMTPEVALQLGKAVAHLYRNGKHPSVVVGKDTRLSGYLLENAITAGLLAGGANVLLVGPLPTPAVAHLVRSFAADAGIMITASHNPAEHNGIKIFDSQGLKLPDEQELKIEQHVLETLAKHGKDEPDSAIGKAHRIDDAKGRYIEFVKATINNISLKGLTIVLDCANGAAYSVSPTILRELGAHVITLNASPDGLNINNGCGALYPDVVTRALREYAADVGISLDGDADRVIMIDEKGHAVDGDHILAIAALALHKEQRLVKKTVVATQYTNKGFEEAMRHAGITTVRVENGDRYVIEEMRKHGYNLGGEQSGHIIFAEHTTTGDGTIAALQVLKAMKDSGKKLSELAACMTKWPQMTEGFAVKEKRPLQSLQKVQVAIKRAEQELKDDGRVFVRYSGTEEKVRIMVEAKDSEAPKRLAAEIAHAFREEGL